MLRQWKMSRFEKLMKERLEVYEAIREKERELEIEQRKEPPFYDSIEHYYEFMDNEGLRQKQLRQRAGDLKLSLFAGSNEKGIARKVRDHLVVRSVLRNEDDYQRVKGRLFYG